MRSLILPLVCSSTHWLISRLAACRLGKVHQQHLGPVLLARQGEELRADRIALLPPQPIGHAELVGPLLAHRVPLLQELMIMGVGLRQVRVEVQHLGHLGLGWAASPGGRHGQCQRDAGGREEEVLARLLPVQLGVQVHGELVVALDDGGVVGRLDCSADVSRLMVTPQGKEQQAKGQSHGSSSC